MKYLVPLVSALAYGSVMHGFLGPHHFVGISTYGKCVALVLVSLWWVSHFIDTIDRHWFK